MATTRPIPLPKIPSRLMDRDLCEEYCIVVGGEEVQSDHDFQCSSCGFAVAGAPPTWEGSYVYYRTCPDCGQRYRVCEWTEET